MLTHTTADARKRTFLTDLIESPGKIALRHQAYELFDINVQRACFNASRILALQASECLNLDLPERKTQCHFLGTAQANVWGKEWQGLTRRFGVQLHPGFVFGRLSRRLLRLLCVQDNPPSIGSDFTLESLMPGVQSSMAKFCACSNPRMFRRAILLPADSQRGISLCCISQPKTLVILQTQEANSQNTCDQAR
jgi:hypothetical protein